VSSKEAMFVPEMSKNLHTPFASSGRTIMMMMMITTIIIIIIITRTIRIA
jgi:hypothetical protein